MKRKLMVLAAMLLIVSTALFAVDFKAVIGQEEDPRAFQAFDRHLQALAQAYPMEREAKEVGEENEKTGYGLEEKEDKKEGKEEEWEVSIGSRLSVSDYTA